MNNEEVVKIWNKVAKDYDDKLGIPLIEFADEFRAQVRRETLEEVMYEITVLDKECKLSEVDGILYRMANKGYKHE